VAAVLAGVRRQLEEARATLAESVERARGGELDPGYRAALRSRNLLFHATRGVCAARGEPLPEMPVVGAPGGSLDDAAPALAAIAAALSVADDVAEMPALLAAARAPYARYLGWLRDELGRRLRGG
jgi:hypothetical protein